MNINDQPTVINKIKFENFKDHFKTGLVQSWLKDQSFWDRTGPDWTNLTLVANDTI
jgi:hypothetical protein